MRPIVVIHDRNRDDVAFSPAQRRFTRITTAQVHLSLETLSK